MTRPLIHIGMAKAASTFLQFELFPHAPSLLNLGKHMISDELRVSGRTVARRGSGTWAPEETAAAFSAAMADRAPGQRPVLSDEDFSVYKFLDPETMARRLHGIFGDYDVLLIIREPVSWLRSNYLFRLGTSNPVAAMGFEDWLDVHLSSRRIGSDVSEIWYSAVVQVYRDLCGGDVHILPYELLKSDKARFAAELGRILGVPEALVLERIDVPRGSGHKVRMTETEQAFRELFRWIVLRQPGEAEARIRAFLEAEDIGLSRAVSAELAALAADGSGPDLGQAAPDQAAWAAMFNKIARRLPTTGNPARPPMPKTVARRIARIKTTELSRLDTEFGFRLADYGLEY